MIKKITTITILITSIVLVSLYVVNTTYSVIINVFEKDNTTEAFNMITIRDILTDSDSNYNKIYYVVVDKLEITHEEGEELMESVLLNDALSRIISNIVDYRLNQENHFSDDEVYSLIISALNSDNNINNELKNKVTLATGRYLNEIIDYIYNLDIESIKKKD